MSLSDFYNKTGESKLINLKIIQEIIRPSNPENGILKNNKVLMEYRKMQMAREDLEIDMAEHQLSYETSMVEVGDGRWQL
jgi:hypothetical protein